MKTIREILSQENILKFEKLNIETNCSIQSFIDELINSRYFESIIEEISKEDEEYRHIDEESQDELANLRLRENLSEIDNLEDFQSLLKSILNNLKESDYNFIADIVTEEEMNNFLQSEYII